MYKLCTKMSVYLPIGQWYRAWDCGILPNGLFSAMQQALGLRSFSYATSHSVPPVSGMQAVGSSLDDTNDEVIFVEEVERTDDIEPESTGQEQSYDETRAAVASLAPDAGSSRSTIRQQSQQSLMPQFTGGASWDPSLDDSIVPSTPTIGGRRPYQPEYGGVPNVNLPQGMFFAYGAAGYIQEPTPTFQRKIYLRMIS